MGTVYEEYLDVINVVVRDAYWSTYPRKILSEHYIKSNPQDGTLPGHLQDRHWKRNVMERAFKRMAKKDEILIQKSAAWELHPDFDAKRFYKVREGAEWVKQIYSEDPKEQGSSIAALLNLEKFLDANFHRLSGRQLIRLFGRSAGEEYDRLQMETNVVKLEPDPNAVDPTEQVNLADTPPMAGTKRKGENSDGSDRERSESEPSSPIPLFTSISNSPSSLNTAPSLDVSGVILANTTPKTATKDNPGTLEARELAGDQAGPIVAPYGVRVGENANGSSARDNGQANKPVTQPKPLKGPRQHTSADTQAQQWLIESLLLRHSWLPPKVTALHQRYPADRFSFVIHDHTLKFKCDDCPENLYKAIYSQKNIHNFAAHLKTSLHRKRVASRVGKVAQVFGQQQPKGKFLRERETSPMENESLDGGQRSLVVTFYGSFFQGGARPVIDSGSSSNAPKQWNSRDGVLESEDRAKRRRLDPEEPSTISHTFQIRARITADDNCTKTNTDRFKVVAESRSQTRSFAEARARSFSFRDQSHLSSGSSCAGRSNNNIPVACVRCRTRHYKCDSQTPCSKCALDNFECVYRVPQAAGNFRVIEKEMQEPALDQDYSDPEQFQKATKKLLQSLVTSSEGHEESLEDLKNSAGLSIEWAEHITKENEELKAELRKQRIEQKDYKLSVEARIDALMQHHRESADELRSEMHALEKMADRQSSQISYLKSQVLPGSAPVESSPNSRKEVMDLKQDANQTLTQTPTSISTHLKQNLQSQRPTNLANNGPSSLQKRAQFPANSSTATTQKPSIQRIVDPGPHEQNVQQKRAHLPASTPTAPRHGHQSNWPGSATSMSLRHSYPSLYHDPNRRASTGHRLGQPATSLKKSHLHQFLPPIHKNEMNRKGPTSSKNKGNENPASIYIPTISLDLPEKPSPAEIQLNGMAKKRRLEVRKGRDVTTERAVGLEGCLAYTVGREAVPACLSCANGHGMSPKCIVVDGLLRGACSNCHYKGQGSMCSFSTGLK